MKIYDLGLRPCLMEDDIPPDIQAKHDLAMMNKIHKRAQAAKLAKERRMKLKRILAKVDAAILGEK